MQYFHTNEDLANIMDKNGSAGIDWEKYGFIVRDISRRQEFFIVNDRMEVLIPITNKALFDKELGNLITKGVDDDGYFYRVLTDKEAQAKKAEFKALREARKADNPVQ